MGPAPQAPPSDHRRVAECGARSVCFRVVANSERGQNIVVITLGPDAPLGRLMTAWCDHHGLPRRTARFAVSGKEVRELRDADTARSLISMGLVSATVVPSPGERSQQE